MHVDAMVELARRSWPVGRHPGGLSWEIATDQLADEVVQLDADGSWAGLTGGDTLVAQVTRDDIARAAIDWFMQRSDAGVLATEAFVEDDTFVRALRDAGFVTHDRITYGMHAGALDAPPPVHEIRSVRPSEIAERVGVHRAAWHPPSLPWHPDHRPDIADDATSGFTQQVYEDVRATALYDIELDLVAVAPDGSFAGCCIVWYDPEIGVAEIEPVGVVAEHRGKRITASLCVEACRRVADRGGDTVYINAGPNEAYPAPSAAYAKAGFIPFPRTRRYVLNRG